MVADHQEHDKDVSDTRAALWASAAGAALPAVAGAGPAATATATVLPSVIVYVRSILNQRARDTQERRAEEALNKACDIVGGLNVVDRWTATDEVRMALLVEVLQAASQTPLHVKIQALAEVLAEGLQTDGAAHEARIIAAALADIEAPHIDLLGYLRDMPLPPQELLPPGSDDLKPVGWEPNQLKKALPKLGLILEGLVAVLAGRGLIASQGNMQWAGISGASQYAITDLGRRCLFLLRFGEDDTERTRT